MARFLVDAQLPPGLAAYLSERGHAAEHVNRVRLSGASDLAIWNYAKRRGAILITKDEDFVGLSARDPSGPQVIWIRIGNIGNEALWHCLGAVMDDIVEALEAGERVIEVR